MVKPPLDFRNPDFSKSFRGYDVEEVEEFFSEILESYEIIYKDNLNLKERLELNEGNINRYKDMEETLKSTLILAQRSADDMRKNAEKESEFLKTTAEKEAIEIVKNAQTKADQILKTAELDAKDIYNQYTDLRKEAESFRLRMRAQLLAQLELYTDPLVEEEERRSPSPQKQEDVVSNEEIEALLNPDKTLIDNNVSIPNDKVAINNDKVSFYNEKVSNNKDMAFEEQATMVIPTIPRIR